VKLHEILDGHLYQRGRADHLDKDVKLTVLEEHDIDYIVNLWKPDPDFIDVPGLTYINYPIPDGDTLSNIKLQMLCLLAEGAATHINRTGNAVLVQCHAGRNRSGLVSALIVAAISGIPACKALDHVRSRRPGAVDNPFFEAFLRSI
jgi:hypothetical protein